MSNKSFITAYEEQQLLSNVLCEDCSLSARLLEIYYQQTLREPDEDQEDYITNE
jgi:hypothetical protein